jgi:serine kinase of HPr protein (carbohydrate metabolism regulator)
MEPLNLHGTGLVLDGVGVMLTGPSGAGKSVLALTLLDLWADRGRPAMLVADDRLDLSVEDGALVMSAPPAIAGLIELRGRGLLRRPFAERARLDLVVDLVERCARMPEEAEFRTALFGVALARCPAPRLGVGGALHQILLVREALRAIVEGQPGLMRQKTT